MPGGAAEYAISLSSPCLLSLLVPLRVWSKGTSLLKMLQQLPSAFRIKFNGKIHSSYENCAYTGGLPAHPLSLLLPYLTSSTVALRLHRSHSSLQPGPLPHDPPFNRELPWRRGRFLHSHAFPSALGWHRACWKCAMNGCVLNQEADVWLMEWMDESVLFCQLEQLIFVGQSQAFFWLPTSNCPIGMIY